MALGWCGACDQLMTIMKVGQKWGSREADWAPVDHRVLVHRGTDDAPCGKRAFETESEGTTRFDCVECGVIASIDTGYATCPGSRRPIR